jgi:hypothetical protein
MRFLEGKGRVDFESATLFGVRVVGRFSDNNRSYSWECLREAIPMVEGAKVRNGHPRRPEDIRDTEDTLGWLENVRQDPADGSLRADLRLLRSHPMCEQILEAAVKRPELYGLSWNADGVLDGFDAEGREQVISLSLVRGVDLVDAPATNKSLFEANSLFGGSYMPSIRHLIHANRRIKPRMKARLKEAVDHSGLGKETPLLEPAETAGNGDWKAAVAQCVGQLVASPDPAAHELARLIMLKIKPGEDDEDDGGDEDEHEGVPAPPPDDLAEDDDDDQGHPRKFESRRPRAAHDAKSFLDAIQDGGGGPKPSRRPRQARSLREAITAPPPATDAQSFLHAITD